MVVQVGDIHCAIRCGDRALSGRLEQLYRQFICTQKPDIYVNLRIARGAKPGRRSLPGPPGGDEVLAEYHPSTPPLAGCSVDIELRGQRLDSPGGLKFMNGIMFRTYYTVRRNGSRGRTAMLVHACGIAWQGQALLFIGPSGSGKSTIARACAMGDGSVVNDETLAVQLGNETGNGPLVHGLPVIGDCGCGLNIGLPLAAVFSIRQSSRTAVQPMSRLDAYLAFIRQVIASQGFDADDDTARMLEENIDFSERITRAVPFYRLDFNLNDRELWETVGNIEVKS